MLELVETAITYSQHNPVVVKSENTYSHHDPVLIKTDETRQRKTAKSVAESFKHQTDKRRRKRTSRSVAQSFQHLKKIEYYIRRGEYSPATTNSEKNGVRKASFTFGYRGELL